MNDTLPPALPPAPPPRRGAWGGWIFLAVLLAPAVIMALVARSSDAQGVVLSVGGGASALYCGIWLARRLFAGRAWALQVLMAIIFIVVLFPVSMVLCCVGCTLGGGAFDMR
jgi:hypothetical protein